MSLDPQRPALSPDNPWPGLDPFDEADQEYFHGRAAESAELLRQVRRELLTVLFGRSGLGKTSLLKAGLFPRLRAEDGLPVYLRLDHAEGASALREQVFGALAETAATHRVQAARPETGESLWSFFHRRDAELWSESHRPVTPVVVLDQFEEIFTLGQVNEAARARSAAFLAELGDLVENRAPEAVGQTLDADPTATRRFDFKRATVKVVLAFREDFLAEMEGLKAEMPSLMYNRFRLLAMNGAQAYQVITKAGGDLVDDEVARRILRLVWKNEPGPPVDRQAFPRLEIDPALLSVVCSELNYKRQQAVPPLNRIIPELLEGADREILAGFYERGMDGLDPRVRAFVEDELITERGYRDSHALEDAQALAGVTAEALDKLVRRRLLRVDERQNVRRLELTHDVLAQVVKESRDKRRAREAEDTAKQRERVAIEQQRRNRWNAFLVGVGAILATVLAVFAGWFALEARLERQRAHAATEKAIEQQTRADKATSQAREERHRADDEAAKARRERERATALGQDSEVEKRKAGELLQEAESTRLMATADRLQDFEYGSALLVNLEAARRVQTLDAQAGLLRRFVSHPYLSAFLSGHKAAVKGVAFSPDGKRLASVSEDKTVVLWDVDSRKPLATLEGHKGKVYGVAFSPDGKRLASASEDQTVILWDVDSRKPLVRFEGPKGEVRGVAFSPDGKRLASASDQAVILWDIDSGKPLAAFDGHKGTVYDVAFSPDGKWLASANAARLILWDVDSGKSLTTFGGHKAWISAIAFSPDGKRLASASGDQTVILWDVASGNLLATFEGHKSAVYGIAFSPDGKRLVSASADQTVILWDVDSHKSLATLQGHKDAVMGVAFSPDGKRLASASLDKTVILWNAYDRKALTRLEGHKEGVFGVAFSPDGKRLASASADKTVRLWDVNNRRPLAKLEGHTDSAIGVAFSPDGKRLASTSFDKTVMLWDVKSRQPLARLEEHKGGVLGVAFSPDGKRLASASWDGTVILWDMGSRKPLATLKGHKDWVNVVAFSPDGKRLASTSTDRTVILWDVESHKPLAKLEGHKGAVAGVAFSPDGKRLATASLDETVILWDVAAAKPLATLQGNRGELYCVAFSPDGKRLASTSTDKAVMLWDVENHKLLATLEGHEEEVIGVAFSPDGKRLASASGDKTVVLWDLDFESLAAEACRTANRNLTCEEWRSYVGADKPYRKTCEALSGPEKCD